MQCKTWSTGKALDVFFIPLTYRSAPTLSSRSRPLFGGGWMSPSINTQKCFDLEKRLLSFMSSRGVVAQLQTQQGHEWNFHSKTVRCLYLCNAIAAFYCFIRDAAGWEPTSILLTQLFKDAFSLSLNTRRPFLWADFQWAGAPWPQQMISTLF